MAEAVAGSTWQIEVPLGSQASSHAFQSSPTIVSGDWKKTTVTSGGTVSSLSNLDNLPTVDPVGSVQVKIILSASETTAAGAGGHINIIGIDASGAEWDPIFIRVDVEATSTNARAADIQSRIPAALVSGRIDASVGAIANSAITAASIASDAITAAKIADDAIDAGAIATTAVTKIQTGLATPTNITAGTITTVTNLTNAPTNGDLTATMKASVTTAATAATPTAAAVTGNVGGNVTGSVASVTAGVTLVDGAITAAKVATGAIDADSLAADAVAEIQSGLATASALATVDTVVDAILADTGTDGVVLSTAQMQALADIVLGRSVSNIDNTAATHSLYELIQAILESNASTGSWVIYKTNGSTTFNTRTLATDADAVPIVGVS